MAVDNVSMERLDIPGWGRNLWTEISFSDVINWEILNHFIKFIATLHYFKNGLAYWFLQYYGWGLTIVSIQECPKFSLVMLVVEDGLYTDIYRGVSSVAKDVLGWGIRPNIELQVPLFQGHISKCAKRTIMKRKLQPTSWLKSVGRRQSTFSALSLLFLSLCFSLSLSFFHLHLHTNTLTGKCAHSHPNAHKLTISRTFLCKRFLLSLSFYLSFTFCCNLSASFVPF